MLGVQRLHYRLEISIHHRINLVHRTIDRIKDGRLVLRSRFS